MKFGTLSTQNPHHSVRQARLPAFAPLLLIAAIWLGGWPTAVGADNLSKFTRQPYLQLATPSSMRIVWRTASEMTPVVRFGKKADDLDQIIANEFVIVRRLLGENGGDESMPLHSAPEGTRQFETTIQGLEHDTRYWYAIFDGDRRLTPDGEAGETYFFETHPKPDPAPNPLVELLIPKSPLAFWVVGDSGTGGSDQIAVFDAMRDYVKDKKVDIDMYLHVGDMAYGSGTDAEFGERFFAIYEPLLRNTVCWPAMGNHEGKTSRGDTGVGPYYDAYVCPTRAEAGGVASGLEAYYSFDYGPVHFVVLDSHDLDRSQDAPMAQWLKADLEQTQAEWLVAYWHHPPYTKGSHDSDLELQLMEMHENYMPLLESAGVDLVLGGHSHIYERSMLIDGAYATPTTAENVILDDGDGDPKGDGAYRKSGGLNPNQGTVAVVAGNGGTGVRRKGTMPVMRSILTEHGSLLVTIEGNTMNGVMINKVGAERDVFSIVKQGEVIPERVTSPWQPSAALDAPTMTQVKGQEMPGKSTAVIDQGDTWSYTKNPDDGAGWYGRDFDSSTWETGKAGFGYGDGDDETVLDDMRNNYTMLRIRRDFELSEKALAAGGLGLALRYDDGFIAYVNGKEALRVGVDFGAGKKAKGVLAHEAGRKERFFPIETNLFRIGKNVIAIEGHNTSKGSSDFTLDPYLIQTK